MDDVSRNARSENMRRVRGKDTAPELAVRRALHAMGLRFRLHRSDLPGRPDIVLPGRRTAIFVHGCFWHRHEGCRRASTPAVREEFWAAKFARTVERDAEQAAALKKLGWDVAVIWECELRSPGRLESRLTELFGCRRKWPCAASGQGAS
jgi:DNA mismatch endonuclease (patch repair protein)